ncbi:MAG TPA: ATP-binding cassette domain-containing protein [Anaerovoracaceae bacterium]|nr:ATP-binding cassette domain-containing protein [Anaerovoracaceae bacterium]
MKDQAVKKAHDIILSLEQVHFIYEDGTEALKGIDLKVRRGEKLAIMGANGSGKSTLFLTLNGVRKPTSGKVSISGVPVDYSRKGLLELRRKVGIVFQDPDNQLFSASVMQEISFGAMNLGIPDHEVRTRVEGVMEELNITPFREKPTHFLSGGQKKRVSIADILVMNPEIIILDEPAAALDPRHARMIDRIIDELGERGITVILSTHDVNRALIWADRVVLLDDGVVIGDGTPEEIFADEKALERTNLEKPTVLKIFETLCESGILKKDLPAPHTSKELEQYIRKVTE